MLKLTYMLTSYASGLLVHLNGKMTPQACWGLLAGGLPHDISSGCGEGGVNGECENCPMLYLDNSDDKSIKAQ